MRRLSFIIFEQARVFPDCRSSRIAPQDGDFRTQHERLDRLYDVIHSAHRIAVSMGPSAIDRLMNRSGSLRPFPLAMIWALQAIDAQKNISNMTANSPPADASIGASSPNPPNHSAMSSHRFEARRLFSSSSTASTRGPDWGLLLSGDICSPASLPQWRRTRSAAAAAERMTAALTIQR